MNLNDTNKVVVTLHKGIDVDAFIDEMISKGSSSPFVPSRQVEISNLKEDSLRNVDFIMTRGETEELRKDPRVLHARFGTKAENGIFPEPYTLDISRSYYRTNTFATGNIDQSWGIPQTNSTTNQYTSSNLVNYQQIFTSMGLGVDFVIQDSGLQVDHPEFTNTFNNQSRVNQINWFTATGVSGTMPLNFYTDTNGHGTNVCGIATGKTYGLAKGSAIYVMNILGSNSFSRLPVSQSFNLLRIWHTQKPNQTNGFWTTKRPTVVNMSWGYSAGVSGIIGGNYRGTNWSGSAPQNAYGVINFNGSINVSVESVNADVEDCLDAGVILVAASGNSAYKIDVPGGLDYNNTVRFSWDPTVNYYYMRGSSPSVDPRVIRVGAVALQRTPEIKTSFSCTGPGVGIYTAGDYVVGPCSNTSALAGYPKANYPYDSNFKVVKVSGTSQASPGVSGLVCCLLQARPWYDVDRIKNWIYDNASLNRLSDTGGGYTDYQSLQGGPNRYLYNPWATGTLPTVIENDSNVEIYARKL